MQSTALRTISKINSVLVPNLSVKRFSSFRYDMTPAKAFSEKVPESVQAEEEEVVELPSNFRYNICQTRNVSLERPSTPFEMMDAQRRTAHCTIEEQNLQPAMMPEYYRKTFEPQPISNDHITKETSKQHGRFLESKTRINCILPLKQVKLASPFPDPVKSMYSRTISDEEKAQQMFAESKSQRCFSGDWGRIPNASNSRNYCTVSRRNYSSKTVGTDSEKCKKAKKEVKKGVCPRMALAGCPPVARKTCERAPQEVTCKKQDAPYPAYSEFCHVEPDEKPSECKLCPWKTEDHPTFKPKKKHFHTMSSPLKRRTGLEEEKVEVMEREGVTESLKEEEEGMLCDLRKEECKRPPRRPCADAGKKKEKKLDECGEEIIGGEDGKSKSPKKKSDSSSLNIARLLAGKDMLDSDGVEIEMQGNTQVVTGDMIEESSLIAKSEDKEEPEWTGKCRKFRFPQCNQPKRKKEQLNQTVGGCPVRKRKLPLRDCPPSEEDGKKCSAPESSYPQYEFANDGEKGGKKKQKPCPKIDMRIQLPEEEDDDPCGLKRKGTTKVCPGDLLDKKRHKPKPSKKTKSSSSGGSVEFIPLAESIKRRRAQETVEKSA